jgi:hypothetical protein
VVAKREWLFIHTESEAGLMGRNGPFTKLADGVRFPAQSEMVALSSDLESIPIVMLRLRLNGDQPGCAGVVFEQWPDGPSLTATAINDIDITELIDSAVGFQAIAARTPLLPDTWPGWDGKGRLQLPGGRGLTEEEMNDIEKKAVALRRQRSVNTELLTEVAKVYMADTEGAPTIAVARELNASKRNATRWVALARKRGLLPEYERRSKSNSISTDQKGE